MSHDNSNEKTDFTGDAGHAGEGVSSQPEEKSGGLPAGANSERRGEEVEYDQLPKTGVYVITNLFDGKQYVGSSSRSIRTRLSSHRRHLEIRAHHSYLLQKAWCRCGASAFTFEALEACTALLCIEKEQQWIDRLRPVYNISPTAGSPKGVKRSAEFVAKCKNRPQAPRTPEWNQRIGTAHKGRVFSQETIEKMRCVARGRIISDATKHKLRLAMTGKQNSLGYKHSQETRLKRRLIQLGKKQTPESIEKMRLASIGRKASDYTRAKMSASAMGHKRCVGRPCSEETRRKISEGNKRRSPLPARGPMSDAQKAFLSRLKTGAKASEETKAKMSASRIKFLELRRQNKHLNLQSNQLLLAL